MAGYLYTTGDVNETIEKIKLDPDLTPYHLLIYKAIALYEKLNEKPIPAHNYELLREYCDKVIAMEEEEWLK